MAPMRSARRIEARFVQPASKPDSIALEQSAGPHLATIASREFDRYDYGFDTWRSAFDDIRRLRQSTSLLNSRTDGEMLESSNRVRRFWGGSTNPSVSIDVGLHPVRRARTTPHAHRWTPA